MNTFLQVVFITINKMGTDRISHFEPISHCCLIKKNYLCRSSNYLIQTVMTFIANPIYDVVFKYLMEDERVAKILLSALLKKEIIELEMRKQEYTAMQQTRISLFRMDFAAKIRDNDGSEHLVLIELQKTWLATETLRFRQYLGTQYLNKENMKSDNDSNYGLPIISIYILGHILGDLKEPVIYVRRRYLDYDDNEINHKDKFIESLTHDSIIVQIPYLQGRTRNRLERLLNLFDQDRRRKDNDHYLEIDETFFQEGDEKLLVDRLLRAGTTPDVRRAMEVEDEILSEIEARDTTIMQKDMEIEQKEQVIEQKEQVIEQQKQTIKEMVQMLSQAGISIDEISRKLSLSIEDIKKFLK